MFCLAFLFVVGISFVFLFTGLFVAWRVMSSSSSSSRSGMTGISSLHERARKHALPCARTHDTLKHTSHARTRPHIHAEALFQLKSERKRHTALGHTALGHTALGTAPAKRGRGRTRAASNRIHTYARKHARTYACAHAHTCPCCPAACALTLCCRPPHFCTHTRACANAHVRTHPLSTARRRTRASDHISVYAVDRATH